MIFMTNSLYPFSPVLIIVYFSQQNGRRFEEGNQVRVCMVVSFNFFFFLVDSQSVTHGHPQADTDI